MPRGMLGGMTKFGEIYSGPLEGDVAAALERA
jgi:hypothetical protein